MDLRPYKIAAASLVFPLADNITDLSTIIMIGDIASAAVIAAPISTDKSSYL